MRELKIILFGALAFILAIVFLLAFVHIGSARATDTKGENAECSINDTGKECDEGLTCVPFNEESGNGKCMNLNVTPTQTPTVSPTPVDCDDCVTPTPTEEVTPTVEPTVVPGNPGGPGDGLSDHRSDGLSSCPKCTQAPNAPSPWDGKPVVWK